MIGQMGSQELVNASSTGEEHLYAMSSLSLFNRLLSQFHLL